MGDATAVLVPPRAELARPLNAQQAVAASASAASVLEEIRDRHEAVGIAAGEAAAGPLSRLSFGWMTPLFELGNSRPLQAADLPPPLPADDAAACYEIFEGMWQRRGAQVAKLTAKPPKKRSPNLQFSLSWRFLGWRFVLSGVLLVAEMLADLSPAVLLNMLVSELEDSEEGGQSDTTTAQLWLICAGEVTRNYTAVCSRWGDAEQIVCVSRPAGHPNAPHGD